MTKEESKIQLECIATDIIGGMANKDAVDELLLGIMQRTYDALDMAIKALENCPPKDSICYGCHDNCKKCECQQMLMI